MRAHALALLLSLAIFAGCAEDATGPDDGELAREPGSGYGELLESAQLTSNKADDAVSCGEETCPMKLCGYTCRAGAQCVKGCVAQDTRAATRLKLSVSGALLTQADSTRYQYQPVLSLNDVIFYGCQLWDFSNGEYDGLALMFSEVYKGAFLAGEPSQKGLEFEVYTKPFTGPGTYIAEGFLSKSSETRAARDFFRGTDQCSIVAEDDGAFGLKGTFRCTDLPHFSSDAKIHVQGEFACGPTGLRLPEIVRMNPVTEDED